MQSNIKNIQLSQYNGKHFLHNLLFGRFFTNSVIGLQSITSLNENKSVLMEVEGKKDP